MPHFPLSITKGGEAILLDDASVPGKTVHTTPAGNTAADLLYLSVVNLSTSERSLFFTVTGTDITDPTSRDGMDRIDVQSSPTGINRLSGEPFVLGPGYSLRISSDTPAGEPPLVLYGYVER